MISSHKKDTVIYIGISAVDSKINERLTANFSNPLIIRLKYLF